MPHGLTGFGSLALAMGDLDRARQIWARLGFSFGPRGRDIGRGRSLDRILLSQGGGLDLLAGAGLGALSLAIGDCDAARASLAGRGVDLAEPVAQACQIELPERSLLLRWRALDLPWGVLPGLPLDLAEKRAPLPMVQPDWQRHANGALGLVAVAIRMPDPLGSVDIAERLFGLGQVNQTDEVVTIHSGEHRLVLGTPADLGYLYPELEEDFLAAGDEPGLAVVTLACADLDAAADYFTQWQIEFEQPRSSALLVPGLMTGGVALEFVAAHS